MTWEYRVAKKEIHHKGELVEVQYGVVEYYPTLGSWSADFQEPLGLQSDETTEQQALEELIWSLEKMLEAAEKARRGEQAVSLKLTKEDAGYLAEE